MLLVPPLRSFFLRGWSLFLIKGVSLELFRLTARQGALQQQDSAHGAWNKAGGPDVCAGKRGQTPFHFQCAFLIDAIHC